MASGNGKPLVEPKGSQLYEVLKGIDFERRELIGKPRSAGLFDLVKDGDKHRCYACTLCERACPERLGPGGSREGEQGDESKSDG